MSERKFTNSGKSKVPYKLQKPTTVNWRILTSSILVDGVKLIRTRGASIPVAISHCLL